jgi:ribosomal protein RSM22 (predicted rRNA methylase)
LDIGSGPGTIWWAAQAVWNISPIVTAIEREEKFIELGKSLGSKVTWIQSNALSFKNFDTHDWVFFGYSLGELPEKELPSLLSKSWKAARKGVVIVEPGTPRGYQRMLFARAKLIESGGFVLAPCPHANTCPIQAPDWCHFCVRLERSYLHKHAKQAVLPFEDEKFTYIIITKEKHSLNPCSRIIRHPSHHSGHIGLSLCTPDGLKNAVIPRSQKELYKKTRKSDWGDLFSWSSE